MSDRRNVWFDTSVTPLPDDVVQSLGEMDCEYLKRLLLLIKATEQRAHLLSEEVTHELTRLQLPATPPSDSN